MSGASYRESHQNRGEDYQESFSKNPHQAMAWRLESRLLTRLTGELFPDQPPAYLDFACGTGRILGHLAPFSRSATGVDVSPTMLDVARRRGLDAELIEADLTRDDPLGEREFDLITAFRFFPNAEATLRNEVIDVLARHLAPSGYLVFNNHKHSNSLARTLAILLGRVSPEVPETGELRVMSREETRDLVTRVGLHIEREIPVISLPFTDRHMLRPSWLLEGMEELLSRVGVTSRIAQSILYVCRKS